MTPLHFCTLFNQHYLDKALAMIHSLQKECPQFHLYCFAFDDTTVEILKKLNLTNVSVISLQEFESPDLLAIKSTRNAKEYCWTSTPFTLKYCLEKFDIPHCTYLDADLYFFNDPTPIFSQQSNWNTLITPHRYTPKYDASQTSGIFCVQWVSINNTPTGLKILNDWCKNCLDWCYEIPEEGKFGDQKYLDNWPQTYEGVINLEDPGIGLAPWNMQQYEIYLCSKKKPKIRTKEGQKHRLIFFHFHHVISYQNQLIHLGDYPIPKLTLIWVYVPYLAVLDHWETSITKMKFTFKRQQASFDKHLMGALTTQGLKWGIHTNWIKTKAN